MPTGETWRSGAWVQLVLLGPGEPHGQSLRPYLFFMTLAFSKSPGQIRCRVFPDLDLSDIFSWLDGGYAFLTNTAPEWCDGISMWFPPQWCSLWWRGGGGVGQVSPPWSHFFPFAVNLGVVPCCRANILLLLRHSRTDISTHLGTLPSALAPHNLCLTK